MSLYMFLILCSLYAIWVLWCDWKRNKSLRELCRSLRDTIENNRWRHAETWHHGRHAETWHHGIHHHTTVIDWEALNNQEYMLEVVRQLREGPPKEREKVNWQKEGF